MHINLQTVHFYSTIGSKITGYVRIDRGTVRCCVVKGNDSFTV